MQKLLTLIFLLFISFQYSSAQAVEEIKFSEAEDALNRKDFKTAIDLINEIKPRYKSVPPKIYYVEVMAKYGIVKQDVFNDYNILAETRLLVSKFLKDNLTRKKLLQNKYVNVESVYFDLNTYPKEEIDFNIKKAKKLEDEKSARETQARLEKERMETKKRKEFELEKAEKEKVVMIEKERIRRKDEDQQAARIKKADDEAQEAERIRSSNEENQKIINKKIWGNLQNQRAKSNTNSGIAKSQFHPFSSIGLQIGSIAKYGLYYESGGLRRLGFHIALRSSLTPKVDILSGKADANKTEIVLGPNFKVSQNFYLNIGCGFGFYNFIYRNDYANQMNIEKNGYLVTSTELMYRANNLINVNAGVSFMDIHKDFFQPEITFGFTFNLKR